MKNILRNVFAAVLFVLTTAAFADAPAPWGPAQRQENFLKGFGLTDAQVIQVLDLFNTERANARTIRAQIKVLEAQIQAALTTSEPDGAAIDKLVDQKVKLQADAQKKAITTEIQIHKIVGDKIFYDLKDRFLARNRYPGGFHRFDRRPFSDQREELGSQVPGTPAP